VDNLKCRATKSWCDTKHSRFTLHVAVLLWHYLFVPLMTTATLWNFFFIFSWGKTWVHLVLRPLFGLLYQPQMIDDNDCGAIGGMRIGRVNRSTRRKPAPVPLRLPQMPHDLIRARTRAAEVGRRRLTAWAMARHLLNLVSVLIWGTYPWLF
jgi:hypothetical protein